MDDQFSIKKAFLRQDGKDEKFCLYGTRERICDIIVVPHFFMHNEIPIPTLKNYLIYWVISNIGFFRGKMRQLQFCVAINFSDTQI